MQEFFTSDKNLLIFKTLFKLKHILSQALLLIILFLNKDKVLVQLLLPLTQVANPKTHSACCHSNLAFQKPRD